jgi:hypothetical protein
MTMRERLARVCCETLFGGFDASNTGEVSPEGQSRKAVDAILDELMKPTPEMVEDALIAYHSTNYVPWAQAALTEDARKELRWDMKVAFTAAIKHAKEGK